MQRSSLALLPLLLAGCAAIAPPGGVTPGNSAEPLAGLSFGPLTAQNARYVVVPSGTQAGSSAPTAPTTATGVPASGPASLPATGSGTGQAAGATSGNVWGGYYGYGPFYGGEAPQALVSLTEATAAGSRGPYTRAVAAIVAPVLQAWASDARLTSSTGVTGQDGLLPDQEATAAASAGYTPGWTLSYFSAARKELLTFAIGPTKTTVVRERWAALDLAAVPIAVDNDAALTALVAAIKTPGAQGEEERSGQDYFLGVPFTSAPQGGVAIAVPPVAASAPTATPSPDQVLYDLAADVPWNASLQVILGKPVWQFYAMSYAKPATGTPDHYDGGAQGMVDARTGAVIRFMRPVRHFYVLPQPAVKPEAAATGTQS